MDNLWKTNSLQNYATKSDFSKLTFKKGDSFQARVLRLEGDSKDVTIKLLDGRVFPAKVEGNISQEKLDNYVFKFELKGFEGGKFVINIVEANPINTGNDVTAGDVNDSLMNELLKNLDFPISKQDVPILKAMLKNNIPLTESNLLEIKGLNQLVTTFNEKPELIDKFISSLLEGKGISPESQEGIDLQNAIKDFLSEAKNLKMDDILVMKSLDIGLSKEEVSAFSKVTSNDYNLGNEIKEVNEVINNNNNGNNIDKNSVVNTKINNQPISNNNDTTTVKSEVATENNKQGQAAVATNEPKVEVKSDNSTANVVDSKTLSTEEKVVVDQGKEEPIQTADKETQVQESKEQPDNKVEVQKVDAKVETIESKSLQNDEAKDNKITSEKSVENTDSKNVKTEEVASKPEIQEKTIQDLKDRDGAMRRADIKDVVKDEIRDKIASIKGGISELMKAEKESPGKFSLAVQQFESKFQELKMFNTINNNYYMLDVPINVGKDDYGCKLIIKDDREKGKKIDSENLKIVASVDTAHMDRVDAYITVQGNFATVEIQSYKKYVAVLNRFKGLLLDDLSGGKYGFNVVVKEKPDEFSFSNCRQFFEDDDFRTINTRV